MYPYIFQVDIPWINITLQPRFYGLFYAISIMFGYKIVLSEVRRRLLPLNEDETMNCVLLIFMGGLLGGRVYEVIFEWSNHYSNYPWTEVFAIWHGGLAIHGGILGGVVSLYFYTRYKEFRFLEFTDIGTLTIILGQALGRWGNFTNGEAAGPVTDSWMGLIFPPGSSIYYYAQGQPVHPTMIYESLGNFIIFWVLWKIRLKNFRHGMMTAVYLVLYSLLRSALTPLRMDNQFFEWMGVRILAPYGISVVLGLAGCLLIIGKRLWQVQPILSATQDSVFATNKTPEPKIKYKSNRRTKKNNKK
ncbi:prolipoprotein diacylglyceryl transferase [Deltaproteobacteria bacterium TL4]